MKTVKECIKYLFDNHYINDRQTPTISATLTHLRRLSALEAENKRMREALTPSDGTRAAYIGEFQFAFPAFDGEGNDHEYTPNVSWTTIKQIMARILNRSALSVGGVEPT